MTDAYEPRQVRKEAAVSKYVRVVKDAISFLRGGRACSVTVRIRMHGQGSPIGITEITPFFSSRFSRIAVREASGPQWVDRGCGFFRYRGLGDEPGLVHGVFTRKGGVSEPPYRSLNTGFGVGDDPGRVGENLRRIREALGAERLVFANQVHGTSIVVVPEGGAPVCDEVPTADALITRAAGTALMVNTADCQGVLLFDPAMRAVAAVHCGWRGNVADILGRVVKAMIDEFGCTPGGLRALIGPSLGPCCGEFVTHRRLFPDGFSRFMVREGVFDLWAVSCGQLIEAGLSQEHIAVAGLCTRCRTDLFYSYRGEGVTGRSAVAVMLT